MPARLTAPTEVRSVWSEPQVLMLHVWLTVEEVICSLKKKNRKNLLVPVAREAGDPTPGIGVRDPIDERTQLVEEPASLPPRFL